LKKYNPFYKTISIILIFLFVFLGGIQTLSAKKGIRTIAILPFKMNARKKLVHIQKGLGHMLYSRLSWKDKVVVIPEKKITAQLSGIDTTKTGKGIREIAQLTHSDFVLAGAVTKLGDSFSIDIQVYDIENSRYITFFEHSQKKDDLINKTNKIAAVINKKIFARTTLAWEKINQEQKEYIQAQKRKNPEYMMKTLEWQDTEKSPGWKIWKYLF